jgi:hypothetical protein
MEGFKIEEDYWTATDCVRHVNSLGIKVTLPTVSNWISKNKLGVQFMKRGAWYVKPSIFKQYVKERLENNPFKEEEPTDGGEKKNETTSG